MAVLPFRRHSTHNESKHSLKISASRSASWPDASTRLAGKLQRLALTDPRALVVLERIVDKWLAEEEQQV